MNDKIIEELYDIRNNLEQIRLYLNKIKEKLLIESFVQTKWHLYDIYNDRLKMSFYQGTYFEGHREVVERLENSDLENVRLSIIDGDKRSCSIFSSEDFQIIIGIIFYNN